MKKLNNSNRNFLLSQINFNNFFSSKISAFAFCLVFLSLNVLASPGSLDWSFGNGGKVTTSFPGGFNIANGIAVQPDQKILVAGATYEPGTGAYRTSVIRYQPDGSLDTSFGSGGRASAAGAPQGNVGGIVLQPDGKIIVGATNWSTINGVFKPRFSLIRFNSNGTLDTSFDGDGRAIYPTITPDGDSLRGIALQPDGKIVATGYTGNPTPQQIVVIRSNPDGSLDTSFEGDGIVIAQVGPVGVADFADDLLIQPDGKIVVVGNGWETGRDILLLRYNPDGSPDNTFGGDGIVTTRILGQASYGYGVALQPDGKLVVAGQYISSFLVLRYNSDGTLDLSFDGDGFNSVSFGGTRLYPSSIAVQKNGRIILAGYADSPNGSDDFAITRFNNNGTLDTSFGFEGRIRTGFSTDINITDKANAVLLQEDGKLIAAGEGATYPPSFVIARYLTNDASFGDFDNDGRSDLAVYRPTDATWYLLQSQTGFSSLTFGISTDQLVAADYDGDGKTDVAVFRPANGYWYLQRSSQGFTGMQFGQSGDVPVPADYDGDGKTDLAVFRPSNGYWYLLQSTGGFTGTSFGLNGDKPVPADYDGDGKADIAVNRGGIWYLNRSQLGFTGVSFGDSNDKLVPSDYDGDGKADIAVFRPSNGVWYLHQSTAGFAGITFGLGTDTPVAADYDGDGKADLAVVRGGIWYLNRSTNGFTGIQFGNSTDLPIPNAFVR